MVSCGMPTLLDALTRPCSRVARAMRDRKTLIAVIAIAGLAFTAPLAGCRQALFPADKERSQFDRYDLSRNQYEPQYVEDEFGRQEPNIKGRLSPKD